MEVSEHAVALVAERASPAVIATLLNISTATVVEHLTAAIQDGRLLRSDVLFTFPEKWRETIALVADSDTKLGVAEMATTYWLLEQAVADPEEIKLFLKYRENRVQLGDMYELLAGLERLLHAKIRSVLVQAYGMEEAGWWRQGVPEPVRVSCAESKERDIDGFGDPYGYTTLIHLKDIMEKRWPLFADRLPPDASGNKPLLFSELKRLNSIRNRVMHPVREGLPTEEDFEFVKKTHEKLHLSRWRS